MKLTNDIAIIKDLISLLETEITTHPQSGGLNRAYSLVVAIADRLEKLEPSN